MASTYTTNKIIEKPGAGDYVDDWDTPVNADLDIIDKALGGTETLSLSSSNVTLTTTQTQNLRIKCTGTLTANITITLPAVGGMWIVDNSTTGSFTVTFKNAATAGVVVTQGAVATITSDGTTTKFANSTSTSLASPTLSGTITMSGTPTITGNVIADGEWAFNNDVYFADPVYISELLQITGKAYSEVDTVAYASSIALNLANGQNWAIGALTGNLTLANPTNFSPGQSGAIHLLQDGTGSRTIAFGNYWKFASGTAPSLSTAANTLDILFYYVVSSTEILCALYQDVSS